MSCLIKTIEAEIIPRLMATYRDGASGGSGPGYAGVHDHDVCHFTEIALNADAVTCMQYIQTVRERGVPLHAIYLHLLTPAARSLNAMWEQDSCDFTQITVALWRMQQVMYDLSPAFQADAAAPSLPEKKIMLAAYPGSQHTIGILMVAEFFRRAGWGVWAEPAPSHDRLVKEVRSRWFDVAGISVGSDAQVKHLPTLITELRDASRNKALSIMVGGPMLIRQPNLAQEVGADLAAMDAQSAVAVAEDAIAAATPQPFVDRKALRAR